MPAPARQAHRARAFVGAILVMGLALTVVAAWAWHSSVRHGQEQAFQNEATDVSATAQTLLRRDTDFLGTLETLLTIQPELSQNAFNRWYNGLEGWQRQAGGLGTTVVRAVPARRLAAFLARRDADPDFRALMGRAVLPVRTAQRARYCLISAGESVVGFLSPQFTREVQEDWCQASTPIGRIQAPLQGLMFQTGAQVVFPEQAEGLRTVLFEQAFYQAGAELGTAGERRATVNGWLIGSFNIAALLKAAITGHQTLAVSLYHSNATLPRQLIGREGPPGSAGDYSQTTTANIEGPWTLTVQGTVATSGLSPAGQGLVVLAIGIILTLLIAALVLVLARSRERALGMVREKTGQLRHQALHDALTGLPNRILALDRAEQMLARARRQHVPIAALYVDIDGFKSVNDTFGHAAGDELLKIVAERLRGVVREGDTAARLSGDEFLVLVEGSTLDAGPELVAERLLDVLRQPYEINAATRRHLSLTRVSVSVWASAPPRNC